MDNTRGQEVPRFSLMFRYVKEDALVKGRRPAWDFRRLLYAPQKPNPILPVPLSCFLVDLSQSSNQTSNIRRRNCLLIDKNHSPVAAALFSPTLQQQRDRSSIIGNKSQTLTRRFQETRRVFPPEKISALPLGHIVDGQRRNDMRRVAPSQPVRDIWRNMLVQQELQHVSSGEPCVPATLPLAVAAASAFENPSWRCR